MEGSLSLYSTAAVVLWCRRKREVAILEVVDVKILRGVLNKPRCRAIARVGTRDSTILGGFA